MINTTTKNRKSIITTIWMLLIASILINNALSRSISVPSPEDIIDDADVIILGEFQSGSNDVFYIDDWLKSDIPLKTSINVIFPDWEKRKNFLTSTLEEPEFKKKIIGQKIIILGKWNPKKTALIVKHGRFSCWPQGIPEGGMPVGNLQELRSLIIEHLKKSKKTNSNMRTKCSQAGLVNTSSLI